MEGITNGNNDCCNKSCGKQLRSPFRFKNIQNEGISTARRISLKVFIW